MKKIIVISILCLVVSFIQAQSKYSIENLRKLSPEELEVYYIKAQNTRKSGTRLIYIGVGEALLGAALYSNGNSKEGFEGIGDMLVGMMLIPSGAFVLSFGISKSISGKIRAERINSIRNSAFNDLSFEIKPHTSYNLITQNYQPGIALSIRF